MAKPVTRVVLVLADKDQGRPVRRNTQFQLASISKSVTSWGIMKLVEQGRLDLDAPVQKYLRRWQLPPSEFDLKRVTARRLLSHMAGISLPGFKGYHPRYPEPTLEQILQGEVPPLDEIQIKYARDWNEDPDFDRERVPVHVQYPPGEKVHLLRWGFHHPRTVDRRNQRFEFYRFHATGNPPAFGYVKFEFRLCPEHPPGLRHSL